MNSFLSIKRMLFWHWAANWCLSSWHLWSHAHLSSMSHWDFWTLYGMRWSSILTIFLTALQLILAILSGLILSLGVWFHMNLIWMTLQYLGMLVLCFCSLPGQLPSWPSSLKCLLALDIVCHSILNKWAISYCHFSWQNSFKTAICLTF